MWVVGRVRKNLFPEGTWGLAFLLRNMPGIVLMDGHVLMRMKSDAH